MGGDFFSAQAKKSGIRVDSAKVGLTEFESVTPSPPDLYANQLRYSPMNESEYITKFDCWKPAWKNRIGPHFLPSLLLPPAARYSLGETPYSSPKTALNLLWLP